MSGRMRGRDSLLKKLKAIQGAPRKAMRAALEKGAKDVVATAKHFAPVNDGKLRDSIGYTFGEYTPDNPNVRGVATPGGGDPDLTVIVHAGNRDAYYAAFVEWGTAQAAAEGPRRDKRYKSIEVMTKGSRGHAATPEQPFFYPAYRMHKKRVADAVKRAARKAIKKEL